MSGYVLIVDDEPEIVRLLEVTLNHIDLRTVTAHDGDEALAQVERETPNLILLDLMMPRVSGFKVLDALRATPSTSCIPIIVISAYTNVPEASHLAASRIMPKGKFGTLELREAVLSALGMA